MSVVASYRCMPESQPGMASGGQTAAYSSTRAPAGMNQPRHELTGRGGSTSGIGASPLEADETLQHASHSALEPDLTLQGHEADAPQCVLDDRLMLNGLEDLVEILFTVEPLVRSERSFHITRPFD